MRTTIEINNENRAKLAALAAKRGLRGYSKIIEEALTEYLVRIENRKSEIEEFLNLAGSLSQEEAFVAENKIKEFWSRWQQ
jgi:predicted transcriptional regulator